ncbi:MAG TPA: EamA family transporter [Kofleriaceae bacterium]|nr:EamA family transporter [Kofleriaceae bacterium]
MIFLGLVYLIWGSTYLAIRVAVADGGGFPPFSLGAVRLVAAGILVLAWAAALGRPLRLSRTQLAEQAAAGWLLWLGGNGLVVWALTRVSSGYAALLMGATPIFVALLEAVRDRRAPTPRAGLGLGLGLGGIAALSGPELAGGDGRTALVGLIALLLAALSWALGTVYQQRARSPIDPLVAAGYMLLLAGIGFGIVALLRAEPTPAPTTGAWWSLAYLVIVGSVVGFASYVYALRLLPADLVMTHAYVNPVVAVVLGWAWLGEPFTGWTWLGSALVLLGVYQVFRARRPVT